MAMKHRQSIEDVKTAAEKITLKRIKEDKEAQAEAAGTAPEANTPAPSHEDNKGKK